MNKQDKALLLIIAVLWLFSGCDAWKVKRSIKKIGKETAKIQRIDPDLVSELFETKLIEVTVPVSIPAISETKAYTTNVFEDATYTEENDRFKTEIKVNFSKTGEEVEKILDNVVSEEVADEIIDLLSSTVKVTSTTEVKPFNDSIKAKVEANTNIIPKITKPEEKKYNWKHYLLAGFFGLVVTLALFLAIRSIKRRD